MNHFGQDVQKRIFFWTVQRKTGGEPMSIASRNVVPEDMRTSVIRIYSYRDKNPAGTFYSLYYGKEIAFGNLTRMLLLMEDLMDEMACPQASMTRALKNTGLSNFIFKVIRNPPVSD